MATRIEGGASATVRFFFAAPLAFARHGYLGSLAVGRCGVNGKRFFGNNH